MKSIDPALYSRLLVRLTQCVEQAKGDCPDFPAVALQTFRKVRKAGVAKPMEWAVGINLDFLERNTEDMLEETVAHEVAHLLVHHKYRKYGGQRPSAHGREWQALMMRVFKVTPSRTHNYDTSGLGIRRQDRHSYDCGCGVGHHKVTTTKHNKMKRGRGYRCLTCRLTLTPTASKQVPVAQLIAEVPNAYRRA